MDFIINLIATRRRPSEKHRLFFKEKTGVDLDVLKDYRDPKVVDDSELKKFIDSLIDVIDIVSSKSQ